MTSSFIMTGAASGALPSTVLPQHSAKTTQVAFKLSEEEQGEALGFLSRRPLHTIFLAGLIRDNGLFHPCNRGTFYGYRNLQGSLTGVALIGDKTVIEAESDATRASFAQLVLENTQAHLIRGECAPVEGLLDYFYCFGRSPRRISHELLFVQTAPACGVETVHDLHPAGPADLEQVISINVAMAFEEQGVNPLLKDPEGVRERLLCRIKRGRVWLLIEGGQIIFKADVISETPEAMFIEGVYVHPERRGRGVALRCMTELARRLLKRTSALCLVINEENRAAQALYLKAGYKLQGHYRTAYFQQQSEAK